MKRTTNRTINRRDFLRSAAGAAMAGAVFPQLIPASALGRAGRVPPSERIVMGCIGIGLQGFGDMSAFMSIPEVQMVAICDVKSTMRERAKKAVDAHYGNNDCATYNDFREIVAREDIDAFCIASLDSWHVLHALAAVRAGKDVYVEKPLGMSIGELKVLRAAVHRYGRVFQFGTQQRSSQEFRHACELAQNGRLGKLHTIKVGVHAGERERSGLKIYPPESVPEWLDYEMWLGPAPWSPYTTERLIYPHWFHISDYSLGYVSGWGIHHIDIAQWGNGTELTGPVEVEGTALFPSDDALCDNPLNWDTRMKYENGVELIYTGDGGGFTGVRPGITFEGADGWVWVNRGAIEAEPKSLLKEIFGPGEIHLPVSNFHQQNLIDNIRSRGKTISPIDVAVRSDTICQLASLSFHLRRKLKWDPKREEFAGDAEANRLLTRALRSP
jgi:predicted dehydrogenase